MDKKRKREMKRQWREAERFAARAEFPLLFDELRDMFDMLNDELPRHVCDHTRRLTRRWLKEHGHGHDVEAVFAWLDRHGGYCDCEVLFNVEPHVDDAMRDIDFDL